VPGIHEFGRAVGKIVDGRDKPGHDESVERAWFGTSPKNVSPPLRGWRAEKRKHYVSVPKHGGRLSARHMRGKAHAFLQTSPAAGPAFL
jgi:hypothetical protein